MAKGGFLYWGIGHDDDGFYVLARLVYDDGRQSRFSAHGRFQNIEEAKAMMTKMADAVEDAWSGITLSRRRN